MLIKSVYVQNVKKTSLFIFILICILLIIYFAIIYKSSKHPNNNSNNVILENNSLDENSIIENVTESDGKKKSYIKWVDFKGNSELLTKLANLDISSHINNDPIKYNWIELMAYLACKYGGDLDKVNQSDIDKLVEKLKSGSTIEELSKDYKLYSYFYESLDAIFHEYIGNYTVQVEDKSYQTFYGLKVFSPIAKNYSFSHYEDFGSSRSYGYKRVHLGNDLLRKYWYSYNCCRIWLCRSIRLESIWTVGVLEYEVLMEKDITIMLILEKTILMLKIYLKVKL